MTGSLWFRRFIKDCRHISPHIRVKRIKHGFYRIYWKSGYIGECFKEMPQVGYDHTDNDIRFQDKKYFEAREDRVDLTRNIKNYVEGYWETLDMIRTSTWMMKHNDEFYKRSIDGYAELVVK